MKAKAALGLWEHFRLGWVEVSPPETPIQTGEVVAVIARQLGLWWINACRIIYVMDEEEPIQRYGFAYGTLPDHAEMGEERFLVEWDRASAEVWYDILAFSPPTTAPDLAGLSLRSASSEAIRRGVGGGNVEGGR